MTLTLYSRAYCSLCSVMRAELEPWRLRYGFGLEVVDVDDDPALCARFDERVPVLMDGDVEICHYHLDLQCLAAHLGEIS